MIDLHLHQWVFDTRALLAFARGQGLLQREVDDGYVVHAALAALFGDRAPGPFVIEASLDPEPGRVPGLEGAPSQVVLSYGDAPLAQLERVASDLHRGLLRWDRCASKPMPLLERGREIGFVARVMPTVRSRAARPGHEAHGRGNGRELDAFLAACVRAPEVPIDRAEVYRDWAARQLAMPSGGVQAAELTDFGLRRFQRVRLLRKEQSADRKRHRIERPDAVITGALRVTEPEAFRALLRRGLGRHRAFGFGMLLVRRA